MIALVLSLACAVGVLAVALGGNRAESARTVATSSVATPARDLPRTRAQLVVKPRRVRLAPTAHARAPRTHVARQAAQPKAHRTTHRTRVRPRRTPFTLAVATQHGQAALASLRVRPAAGWRVQFAVYRGRYLGMTDSGTKVITLWVKPSDSRQQLRITLAHELGHVLDFTTVGSDQRTHYLSLRGRAGNTTRWYPCNGCEDYAYPAGDFAEVYALWVAGAGDFRSRFAAAPNTAQLTQLGTFFHSLQQT